MEANKENLITEEPSTYLVDEINELKNILSIGLNISADDIKVSFPTLKNFYSINNVFKSSWAIYSIEDKLPKLYFTGNFLIQGGAYPDRSKRSPYGIDELRCLSSIANTFSVQASIFKQNWTMDLNIIDESEKKLNFTVKEYQDFLNLLNSIRAKWLLHLCEEGNFDFAICEFSESADPMLFLDMENLHTGATKIKTYFKPVSNNAIEVFKSLSSKSEYEGKFFNIQPGTWVKEDVLIEMEKLSSNKFFLNSSVFIEEEKENILTPFEKTPFNVQFKTT